MPPYLMPPNLHGSGQYRCPHKKHMKFKIDENLPIDIAELLTRHGHDAMTIVQQNMSGEKDPEIAVVCQREKRIIVTLDMDFADIRTYPPAEYSGIIVLRLKKQDKPYVLNVFKEIPHVLKKEPIEARLWIVDEDKIRIRE